MTLKIKVINVRPKNNILCIVMLDDTDISLTQKCDIYWPHLPPKAKYTHIIPKLVQKSLILVVKLCDAGYTKSFEHNSCIIFTKGSL